MKLSKNSDIPVDIYVRFVRSLFNDAPILVIGALCHSLIAIMVYDRTGDSIYLGLAGLMLAAGVYRYFGIRGFQKSGTITDYRSAMAWELRYLVRGTIQGFCLGLFAFVAIYWSPDSYGELAAVGVAMGSTVTIAGRNYGSKTMVAILSTTVVLPVRRASRAPPTAMSVASSRDTRLVGETASL